MLEVMAFDFPFVRLSYHVNKQEHSEDRSVVDEEGKWMKKQTSLKGLHPFIKVFINYIIKMHFAGDFWLKNSRDGRRQNSGEMCR